MIIVKLVGRLGNQLFQYAFALSEQKRLGTFAVIDDREQRDILSEYFTVRGIRKSRLLKKLIFKLNRLPVVYQDGDENPAVFIAEKIRNNQYYYAYLQSELYFKTIQPELSKLIQIKANYQQAFQDKYGALFSSNKVLAIHYRFGDYLHWDKEGLGGPPFNLPADYYKNALSAIPDLDKHLVILVTDDPQLCESQTGYIKQKTIVCDSEIMDFQILMNANTLIVANSSFSWWAAYMNQKNGQVFAPRHWLGFKVGFEFPNSIIPERFTKVAF